MPQDLQKQRTLFYWRRLSTTLCAAILIAIAPGCATRTVAEAPKEIPQTLLTPELPSWKSWFNDWLTLVRNAADIINGAQPTTTPSPKS